jgi:lipopolysaccharide/colanic/teichoic acid biosynthesis glycosyltransferase
MSRAGHAVKRVFDIVVAGMALAVLVPVFLLLAILIRVGSPGPAIFRQERAGKDMKPFTMYKFRSMRADVDRFGVSPSAAEDPRLTRLGRWLRETSIDELPQLWNILKGDMSLVGPRPLYMSQAREFTPHQRRRLEVRPGIFGLAQIQGRGDLPHDEKLQLDVRYVDHMSLAQDLRILWRGVTMSVRRQKVYQKWR